MCMPIWRFDPRKGTSPMKKKTIWALAVALLALLATGCAAQTNGQTTIVTSFYPMYVLTLNVTDGIDDVTVQNMAEQNVGVFFAFYERRVGFALLLFIFPLYFRI